MKWFCKITDYAHCNDCNRDFDCLSFPNDRERINEHIKETGHTVSREVWFQKTYN